LKATFIKLCNGTRVDLTVNKRNNETDNYYRILNGDDMEALHVERPPQYLNLVKTNWMRRTINFKLMNKQGYFIKMAHHKDAQDMWLDLNTPVMGIRNNEKLKVLNGKFYRLTQIKENSIRLVIDKRFDANPVELEHTFTDKEFADYFIVAFAVTNHKVQGITIREPYNIYQWDKMVNTALDKPYSQRFTAYSRCSDGKLVGIIDEMEPDPQFCIQYCIYKWSSEKCNDIYVGHAKDFDKRRAEHLAGVETRSEELYQKMRETDVATWKMERLETFFAANLNEALEKEQYYISELNSNLNMCRAVKL